MAETTSQIARLAPSATAWLVASNQEEDCHYLKRDGFKLNRRRACQARSQQQAKDAGQRPCRHVRSGSKFSQADNKKTAHVGTLGPSTTVHSCGRWSHQRPADSSSGSAYPARERPSALSRRQPQIRPSRTSHWPWHFQKPSSAAHIERLQRAGGWLFRSRLFTSITRVRR